ncbi:GIY-YIG nuclease family protein [Streptomyces sp. NPDC056165]|uniref:GIY-YIG nuclease family protein n=1 Tax=Streptomyces sp. NPDC056165 TaxID=3345733 RepID=UPI0035E0E715
MSAENWAAFRARVEELGGTVLGPEWLGSNKPHRVECAKGHACSPRPKGLREGKGLCRTCAGKDPLVAEAAFRARLAEVGATLLEPKYLGRGKPHRVMCAKGHICAPRPQNASRVKEICRVCAGRDSQASEATFRARLAEAGATLLEPKWLGVNAPHRLRCSEGHIVAPSPTRLQQGGGICAACAGRDSRASEAAFRARLAEAGATLLEPKWLGSDKPHRVLCAEGHASAPYPNRVKAGGGACRICSGRTWNVLYVVADDAADVLKFGITTGDPQRRLIQHRRDGFVRVVRLVTGLPDGKALEVERALLHALRDAGEAPVRGREYFPAQALPLVLALIDSHPITKEKE